MSERIPIRECVIRFQLFRNENPVKAWVALADFTKFLKGHQNKFPALWVNSPPEKLQNPHLRKLLVQKSFVGLCFGHFCLANYYKRHFSFH